MENCKHKRIKKNYIFGKKSKGDFFCKDCGELMTGKMLKEIKKTKKGKKRRKF